MVDGSDARRSADQKNCLTTQRDVTCCEVCKLCGRFWRSKVGNLSKDVFETDVVCHALGNTLHEVGISARSSCKCMDDLADQEWQLGRIALFGQVG